MSETAVAHHAWDKRWSTPEGRADWLDPEPFLLERVDRLGTAGDAVLDLGCGVGRNAIALAQRGFKVDAMDGAPAGLEHGALLAQEAGVVVAWRLGGMLALPYADRSFDAVVSWNVIYHGTGDETRRAMSEICRVLKPGGRLVLSLLSKRERRFGLGREVADDTYVIEGEEEKGHPHHYVDAVGAAALFRGFNLVDLEHRVHRKPESWHWDAFAVKDAR